MTIYMVQHAFSRRDWEDEWNAWYAGNLRVLMAVPGFRTGQRFKAIDGAPSRYMAAYTVESPEVFESRCYLDAGGGGTNSQRYRPAYQVWIRNLFEGLAAVPEVREGEYLVCVDSAAPDLVVPGVRLLWLKSTGFHRSTPYRGIVVLPSNQLKLMRRNDNVTVYQPLTAQQAPLY